ncbi:MAG: hypothetical protein D6738_07355 [Acidobacteria bacterium]|nr:MAG: hypothetical protein D6738_07355 [Acidobacteriota bacterium]
MTATNPPAASPRRRRSFVTELLDEIGSVWFGVTMMVLILAYCWIGSAGTWPLVWFPRQAFELTEMEWFGWWPFQVLVGLLCLSLILVTLRRIRFNLPNLGVWTVHAGILVLALGSTIYFGRKIEGDMAVYRRQAEIEVAGGEKVALPLQPGASITVRGPGRIYDVRVAQLQHDYELLTGDDAGKKTYAAQLFVQPVVDGRPGRPFIRQVLDGYPQYTEDVIPGRGRAVKVEGRAILDEAIRIGMSYHAPDRIHLHDRRALHVRPAGTNEPWHELALPRLPRYHEYMDATDRAFVQPGEPPLLARPLRLRPRPKGDPGPAAEYELTVTGFMPYADLVETWEPGGRHFNPYLRFEMRSGQARVVDELLARVPGKDRIDLEGDFSVAFRWVESEQDLERMLAPEPPALRVRVPGRDSAVEVPLADAERAPVAVPGTGVRLAVEQVVPRWTTNSTGQQVSMVLVRVETPGRTFRRAVIWPDKSLSRDIDASGHMGSATLDRSVDLELTGLPEAGLFFVAGPVGTHVLLSNLGGDVRHRKVEIGQPVSFLDGALEVRVLEVAENSRRLRVPRVVPRRERNPRAGDAFAVVQLELRRGDAVERRWIPYSPYTHPNRFSYRPEVVRVGDGPALEVLFSRETWPLPAPVALERFELETYPGGQRERDFISLVRFLENGRWSELHEVRSNQPTEHAGWWYFQATWDPPDPARNYAGMFYTGLGVGNRHGVMIMLLGSVMTIFGTIWAFYVKPVILRRRRDRGAERRAGRITETAEPEREVARQAGAAMAGVEDHA